MTRSCGREFQDLGNGRHFGRRDDGRTGLARHYVSPGYIEVPYGTGSSKACGQLAGQFQVAPRRHGISPSSMCHKGCVSFAASLQPARAESRKTGFFQKLNAGVASVTARRAQASRPAPSQQARPVRSQTPLCRPSSRHGECSASPRCRRSAPACPAQPFPSALADQPRTGNVVLRLHRSPEGCGRTDIRGETHCPFARPGASAERPAAGANSISVSLWCCVGAFSCTEFCRRESEQQSNHRQAIAISGNILPNPCGLRFCVATFGARTLRRNSNSDQAAAIGLAALGRLATARHRSTSCCCFSVTKRSGAKFSTTSCAIARRHGGLLCSARNASPLRSTNSISNESSKSLVSSCELVERHRPDRVVMPVSGSRSPSDVRRVSSLAWGRRRACGLPHAGAFRFASSDISEHRCASATAHACAWSITSFPVRNGAHSPSRSGAHDTAASHDRDSEKLPMALHFQCCMTGSSRQTARRAGSI